MRKMTTLAGLTAAVLLFAAAGSFGQDRPARTGGRGTGERLAKLLELTPEQRARFAEIRKARREEGRAFREEMRKLRPELGEAMKDPRADQKTIDGLIDRLSQHRSAHLKSQVRSRKDMEQILTPDQLEKFRRAGARLAARRGFDRGDGPRRWQRPGRRPGHPRALGGFGNDWF